MTPEETRKLIDQLDENRKGQPPVLPVADQDPQAAQEWYYLNLAVDAVRNAGLYDQVARVKENLREESTPVKAITEPYMAVPANQPSRPVTERSSPTIIRTIGKYSMRAAAVMLIITSGSVIYKYVTVSSSSLYDRYFGSYSLNTSRGETTTSPIVDAYNTKDWNQVLTLAGTAGAKDNQAEFLAGMADLQLNRCSDAITHFEQVIAANAQASTDYYQDEAEYYLAISWLACKKVNQAMPILEKIKADPHHQYHQKVAEMSFFDLRLAQYKENK
jgi:hypothetical protein